MVPPAPVRFSTTMVCPSCCESCSNTMRGMMSVELPAAKGTTARSGFVGQLCAPASVVANERTKAGTSIRQIGFMTTSLVGDGQHRLGPIIRPIHYYSRLYAGMA